MKEAKNSLFGTLVEKCVKSLKGRAFQRGFERFTLLVNKPPRVLLLQRMCHTCRGLGLRTTS